MPHLPVDNVESILSNPRHFEKRIKEILEDIVQQDPVARALVHNLQRTGQPTRAPAQHVFVQGDRNQVITAGRDIRISDSKVGARLRGQIKAGVNAMEPISVLSVFANPKGTTHLRLSAEDRAIRECIRYSLGRDHLHLDVRHAATIHDVRRALLEKDYRIVHFSGHGTGKGLVLEDELGQVRRVPQEALAEFLSAYSPPIECVILNACYSIQQGQMISMVIPYTIAMRTRISDEGAIEFTRGFYDAIGAGKSIEFAYEEGCRTIKLMNLPDGDAPVLFKKPS